MEKLEPTLDKRCGKYAGYKAHRDRGEQLCQPCRDAMNAYRRAKWVEEPKYREHGRAYKKRHPERVKEQMKKYSKPLDPEVKAARKALRAQATAQRAEVRKAEKQATRVQKLEEQKKQTLVRKEKRKAQAAIKSAQTQAQLAAKYAAMNQARQARKLAEKAEKAAARKEASQRLRHQRNEERKANCKIRETNRTKLAHQHGTGSGDYNRCRKNNNGVACAPCKAGASKYAREKFHSDPKYKEAEKRWKQANPCKVYRDNKYRAVKHGGKHKYYTRQHIFDRDGYDCYLCNIPVDLKANHIQGQPGWELYPHIEHVKPLSKGGDDTLANVKIAHAICNIRKGVQFDEATATT
jgi:HNH endonuclease